MRSVLVGAMAMYIRLAREKITRLSKFEKKKIPLPQKDVTGQTGS